jgi:hypothetical protein
MMRKLVLSVLAVALVFLGFATSAGAAKPQTPQFAVTIPCGSTGGSMTEPEQ